MAIYLVSHSPHVTNQLTSLLHTMTVAVTPCDVTFCDSVTVT